MRVGGRGDGARQIIGEMQRGVSGNEQVVGDRTRREGDGVILRETQATGPSQQLRRH